MMTAEAALLAAISSALSKEISAQISKIISNIPNAVGKSISSFINNWTPSLENHFRYCIEKCTKIKTLINQDSPASLLDQYVNIEFRQGSKKYDDYSIIELLPKHKHITILGTAGSGKSIFMKYLWLSLYSFSNGKIPIFVELRKVNDVSDDLLVYIFHTIAAAQPKFTKEHFDTAISKGLFAFVLDGFDEVLLERRDAIEKQIIEISHLYSDNLIAISSRPDTRFGAWQSFTNFKVSPFNKNQIIEMINKIDYDKITKSKFKERINGDLYEKHESFLTNPLLTTMMLLVFHQFADIPQKVHLFYEQAFDTLYARHDALKESYKRKMHTNLSIDKAKRVISYFCLFSYFEENYEFTDIEIEETIDRAILVSEVEVDANKLKRDLEESICLIQKDGILYTFSHRSFQEFFSAYCLARLPGRQSRQISSHIFLRSFDSVLTMLFDMNQYFFETEIIIPIIKDHAKVIVPSIQSRNARQLMKDINIKAAFPPAGKDKAFMLLYSTHETFGLSLIMRTLYPSKEKSKWGPNQIYAPGEAVRFSEIFETFNIQRRKGMTIREKFEITGKIKVDTNNEKHMDFIMKNSRATSEIMKMIEEAYEKEVEIEEATTTRESSINKILGIRQS